VPAVPVCNMQGDEVEELDLSPAVWEAPVNDALMHQVVVAYLANQRAGSASTKGRAEVRGGGRKPWRQKGLGRARHGSIRSPIWRGGGVTFGPKPRDYRKSVNKKARRNALKSALSAVNEESAITFLDAIDLPRPKTRDIVQMLRALGLENRKVLIVMPERDDTAYRSVRNIPNVSIMRAEDLNTYEVLNAEHLIVVRDAVPVIEGVLASA